jgi:hypothetical protein
VDDPTRPRVFDCHVLQFTGHAPWPASASHRIEIHVEHDTLRLYSHQEISRYRAQYEALAPQQARTKPAAKGRGGARAKPAIVRSIYDDIQA